MKPVVKGALAVMLVAAAFVAAVIIESHLRSTQQVVLPIAGLPIEGAEISGRHLPDFLWSGRAWTIDITTTRPLILSLDQWTGTIPPGSHRLFANHDATNTGDYSGQPFWGMPESVRVEAASPERKGATVP